MTHTNIPIDPKRVKALLAAYGADTETWPDGERGAALKLIEVSDELQLLQKETLRLDKIIGLEINTKFTNHETNIPALSKRILNALPAQENTENSNQKSSQRFSWWSDFMGLVAGSPRLWLGAGATAALASLMAIAIINSGLVLGPTPDTVVVAADFDQWALSEVLDQPLDDSLGYGDGDSVTVFGLL